jgi:hypothetical protein
MRFLFVFIIRAVLAVILAFMASRMFSRSMETADILGLAAILLGLAYLFQYVKKQN